MSDKEKFIKIEVEKPSEAGHLDREDRRRRYHEIRDEFHEIRDEFRLRYEPDWPSFARERWPEIDEYFNLQPPTYPIS